MKYDCIIIGAGMAGLTAAIYLQRAGKKTLVLESKIHGGQIINTINIENWPGNFRVSGAELMQNIYEQAKELGAEVRYEEVLEVIDGKEKIIKTEDEEYLTKSIIIATGTEPRKMSAKQTADAGDRPISYCATCDGALYKNKTVVVVGSGNTAKHEISYLEGICKKVYQIHHDEPIPKDAEAIFVAIGRIPSTGLARGLVELDSDGYIVADESCATSCPGIFAAGDCRTKSVRQLVTASGDGAIAVSGVLNYLKKD